MTGEVWRITEDGMGCQVMDQPLYSWVDVGSGQWKCQRKRTHCDVKQEDPQQWRVERCPGSRGTWEWMWNEYCKGVRKCEQEGRIWLSRGPRPCQKGTSQGSQLEMQAKICQVLRVLSEELKICIYDISYNVKCWNVFLSPLMWTKLNRTVIVIQP